MAESLLQVTYLYMLALLLCLTIERLMEVINAGWNLIEWKFNLHLYWTRRAIRLQQKYEELAQSRLWNRLLDLSNLSFQVRDKLLKAKAGHSGKILTISGNLVRNAAVIAGNRVLSALFGVLFCWLTHINLVAVLNQELKLDYQIITQMPPWLAIVLSGIFIGAGAEPVHHVIQALEKRRKK